MLKASDLWLTAECDGKLQGWTISINWQNIAVKISEMHSNDQKQSNFIELKLATPFPNTIKSLNQYKVTGKISTDTSLS